MRFIIAYDIVQEDDEEYSERYYKISNFIEQGDNSERLNESVYLKQENLSISAIIKKYRRIFKDTDIVHIIYPFCELSKPEYKYHCFLCVAPLTVKSTRPKHLRSKNIVSYDISERRERDKVRQILLVDLYAFPLSESLYQIPGQVDSNSIKKKLRRQFDSVNGVFVLGADRINGELKIIIQKIEGSDDLL